VDLFYGIFMGFFYEGFNSRDSTCSSANNRLKHQIANARVIHEQSV